jgi:hypothetical protein
MRFGDRDLWKIGHTNDVAARLVEVNKHVPHEILGERWTVFLTQQWPTPAIAYAMEQRIFANLGAYRTTGERVRCAETDLIKAWQDSLKLQGLATL